MPRHSRFASLALRRPVGLGLAVVGGLLASAALLGLLAPPVSAAPAGQFRNFPGSAPCNTTLQACIDGADPGDTIVVQPATYNNTAVTLSKAVSLTGVASNTAILGGTGLLSGQRILTVTGPAVNSNVVISGLTFFGGGIPELGGGILITGGASPLLSNLIITFNLAYTGGGIYAHTGSLLRLQGVQLVRNIAFFGGGGAYAGGGASVSRSLFFSNTADTLGLAHSGGGLYAAGSTTLNNTDFISNVTGLHGGGLYASDTASLSGGLFQGNACSQSSCEGGGIYAATALIGTGVQFLSNYSAGTGGGVRVEYTATLTSTQFFSNVSEYTGGGAHIGIANLNGGLFQGNECEQNGCYGGGVFAWSASINGTHFIHNTSRAYGGGAYVAGAAALNGGLFQDNQCTEPSCYGGGLSTSGQVALTSTQFLTNTSQSGGGGAFAYGAAVLRGALFQGNHCVDNACRGGGLMAGEGLDLQAARFIGNSAGAGGGLTYLGPTGQVVNSLFAGNSALGNRGAAMQLGGSGNLSLLHNTVASATLSSGSAIYVVNGNVTALNNLVSKYAIGMERAGGTFNEDYTLFSSVFNHYSGTVGGGIHSIDGLAGFIDPAAGDFRLGATSDAVDAGTDAGIDIDAFDKPRPLGDGFDIGFFEFGVAPVPPKKLYLPLVLR